MDQFHGLFVKLDQNKDGLISVEELHEEMRKHGILSADGKVQVVIYLVVNDLYMYLCSLIHSQPANQLGMFFL